MEVSNLEKELTILFKSHIDVDIKKLLEDGLTINNKNNVLKVLNEFLILHTKNDSVLNVDSTKIKEIRTEIFERSIPIALTEIEATDFEGSDALSIDELINISVHNIISDILQMNIGGIKIKKLNL
jgi:predicted nuclease of restriction endonuclease-like RecB superfamily